MKALRIIGIVVLVIVLLPIVAIGGLVLFVQSETGERWFEKQVAVRTHRDVDLEGIRVHFGWPPVLTLERLRISNPPWARGKDLVDAQGFMARVEIPPLFEKRIVVPYLAARGGTANLEQKGGQATWRFDAEQKAPSRIELRLVALEDGHIAYRNVDEDTDLNIDAKGSLGESGELTATATGKFRGDAAKGSVTLPALQANPTGPIRFKGKGSIGATEASADGNVAKDLQAFDFRFTVGGHSMKDLHHLTGVVLPDTPQYKLSGRLQHKDNEWVFEPFQGVVGDSDLRGTFTFRKTEPRPMMVAKLESKQLDLKDLGPVIGTPKAAEHAKTPQEAEKAAAQKASDKVLPHEPISTEKWGLMDADVQLVAQRVLRPKQLPLDALSTHIVLKDSVLHLEPLNFVMADGRITSNVVMNGKAKPTETQVKADVQGMHLGALFPAFKTMDEALGTLYGRADLKGHGASIGEMLGTSNGKMVVASEGGQISELLTHLLEIDVQHALMLLGTKNQQVELRCAVGQLDVKDGVISPESFVVDTTDTLVNVSGKMDLANERFDIETKGHNKKPSVFLLRTPIVMEGPLKKPKIHPKAGPLVVQAGAAAALGAVAGPLAIAPFLDPGKKQDADCDKLLAEAKQQGAVKKVAAKDDPAEQKKAAEGKPTVPQKKTTSAKSSAPEKKPNG
jgi:uncharacterized protein involved in outer membrane biogenesis